jgi:hypothetical protein
MFPMIPSGAMSGGFEILCYVFTVAGALFSCLYAMRA